MERIKELNDFTFYFHDIKAKKKLYVIRVKFKRGNLHMEVQSLHTGKKSETGVVVSTPEKVFLNNARFEDILQFSHLPIKYNIVDIIQLSEMSDEKFLIHIRNNPWSLDHDETRKRFVTMMIEARWGDNDDRKKIIEKLKSFLIPAKKAPKFTEFDLVMKLMKDLSKWFSENIRRQIMAKYDYMDSIEEENWPETFEEIKEGLDPRIKKLSEKEIFLICTKPAKFVEKLIIKTFNKSRAQIFRYAKRRSSTSLTG